MNKPKSVDQSHLDNRYFVDNRTYNCPFCNRRNVLYSVVASAFFHWDNKQTSKVFVVVCSSCRKRSLHLTHKPTIIEERHDPTGGGQCFEIVARTDIDELIFYSTPTSFFTLDQRIPRVLRELFVEAQGCLKMNYLTGASACARKVIYELAKLQNATGNSYEERIRSLKKTHTHIDPFYFDTLIDIQAITSNKVHENAYDGWKSQHLRVILASLTEVLHELYVLPARREDSRQAITELKQEIGTRANKPNNKGNT